MRYTKGYDPDFFRTTLHSIIDILTEDRRQSLEGVGKVLVQKSINSIAEELGFTEAVRNGGADLTR